MSADTTQPQDPFEQLIVERALLLAREMRQAAAQAPDGQVLDQCEAVATDAGRAFLTEAMAATLQEHIDHGADPKKGAPIGPVRNVSKPPATKGPPTRRS